MAGTIVVDRIESDSSYTSSINVASKVNFTGGMQVGGQDFMVGGMRNRVINGGMRIDQRNAGAAVTCTGVQNVYAVDRTLVANATGTANTTVTAQQVAVTSNIGFDYAIRATIGNNASRGNNFDARFQHNIEGNNVADYIMGVTTMVATFWARASKTGFAYYVTWSSNAGTGVYFYKRISLTTSWQKITVSIPACALSGADVLKTNGRGFGTGLYWATSNWSSGIDGQWATAAQLTGANLDDFSDSGDWIEFTGYQLEYGSTPTSFEYRSYQQELALCQRYYTKTYRDDAVPGTTTSGQANAIWSSVPATNSYPQIGQWFYPVTMRATPTIVIYNPNSGTVSGFIGDSTNYSPAVTNTIGNKCVSFYGQNVSVGTSTFISVHATASAEL
jgi:hypothetical protein